MNCLICSTKTDNKLCDSCDNLFTYDSKYKLYRRKKKTSLYYVSIKKEHINELLLFKNVCKIFGSNLTFRNIYPIWAISQKNVLYEYDIGILREKVLIEYDGIQHFEYPNFFHRNKNEFLEQQLRDKIKDKLAKENGWNLIRFSYKEQIDDINVRRKIKC